MIIPIPRPLAEESIQKLSQVNRRSDLNQSRTSLTKVVPSVKNVDHGVTTLISIVLLVAQDIYKLKHNFTQQLNLVPEK